MQRQTDAVETLSRATSVKPVLQAILLADRVWKTTSGQHIIAGTINQAFIGGRAAAVESATGDACPTAYVSLTDVDGRTEISLEFVSLGKNQSLFGTSFTIEPADRRATVEIVAPLPRLPIEAEGDYALQVVWQGEVLGSHRIRARATGGK